MEEHAGYAERSLADFVPKGVLYAVDMGGELSRLEGWQREIESNLRAGPKIYAAGPFIDGKKELDGSVALNEWRRRSMRVVDSPAQVLALVDELDPRIDLLKVHSRVPIDAFFAVAQRARSMPKPLAVHLPVGLTVRQAVDAGASTIEHTISFLQDAIYEEDPQAGYRCEDMVAGVAGQGSVTGASTGAYPESSFATEAAAGASAGATFATDATAPASAGARFTVDETIDASAECRRREPYTGCAGSRVGPMR